MMPMKGNPFRR